MNKFPQIMINVALPKKIDVDSNETISSAVAEAKGQLDGHGRVLLRRSGTEPVVRVMVEGEDAKLVSTLATDIATTVEQQMSQ